ncbi:MAG: hypothetical protein HOK63_06455 [Thaumarchaeota archaeon]|jgi:hypothetical protein|nr:hypothetical protein [Nitrososphaerota archaeon]MBT5842834.1 hypothetical protein [Nitrososphaerota archaeon]MBT6469269.1 hypothetical protein [Nitrososphaerota archaeon]
MSSADEIFTMFETESSKLITLINVTRKPELTVHEIIETYYQIMNVSSMITMLKQQGFKQSDSFLEKLTMVEAMISEFNSDIHPQIIQKLEKSIQDTTSYLQSENTEKSPEEIQNDAKYYDELREKMSTKEFVDQYGKGLSND